MRHAPSYAIVSVTLALWLSGNLFAQDATAVKSDPAPPSPVVIDIYDETGGYQGSTSGAMVAPNIAATTFHCSYSARELHLNLGGEGDFTATHVIPLPAFDLLLLRFDGMGAAVPYYRLATSVEPCEPARIPSTPQSGKSPDRAGRVISVRQLLGAGLEVLTSIEAKIGDSGSPVGTSDL